MIQLIATGVTDFLLIGVGVFQFIIGRNVQEIGKINKDAFDRLTQSGRKMGEGWVEVARAVDAQEKRIALMEQRLINLEGRRWTVHNGGRPSDPEGGGTAA
jgi:hypothetical protein